MARANVYNNDNQKKVNKPLLIGIISGVAALVIAGIVCLSLWLGGVFDQKDVHNYFSDYENLKVKNITTLDSIIENDKKDEKHTFIFVYNNETFDTKENDTDAAIEKQIKNLAKAISEKTKGPEDAFHLYLFDSSVEGNEAILKNPNYGNIEEGSALLYFYMGTQYNQTPEDLESQFPEDLENPKHVYTLSVSNDQALLKNKLPEVIAFVNEIYNFQEA